MEFLKHYKKDGPRWMRNISTPVLLLFLTGSAAVGAQANVDFRTAIQNALANKNIPVDEWGCVDVNTPGILEAKSGDYPMPDGSILKLRNSVQTPHFITRLGSIQENGKTVATTGSSIDRLEKDSSEQTKICGAE